MIVITGWSRFWKDTDPKAQEVFLFFAHKIAKAQNKELAVSDPLESADSISNTITFSWPVE